MVGGGVEGIVAEQQQPPVDPVEDDPADRLRAVRGIAVLFEGAELDELPLLRRTIGKSGVGFDHRAKALGRVGVSAEVRIGVVGALVLTGLLKAEGLPIGGPHPKGVDP